MALQQTQTILFAFHPRLQEVSFLAFPSLHFSDGLRTDSLSQWWFVTHVLSQEVMAYILQAYVKGYNL